MKKIFQNITKETFLWILISTVFYSLFAYNLERQSFGLVLLYYTILFAGFIRIVILNKGNFFLLIGLTIFFRLLFLGAIPNLSNDFYRFIWDGRMIWEGLNPYLSLPENNPNIIAEGQILYEGMGAMNGSHYTCYPPINQFTFLIPAILFSKSLLGSTIVMRLLIIAADIGTFYYGKKLLDYFQLPKYTLFLYLLNPFIILELTGNLHFEGVMIFFLAAALYYLFKNKWMLSALLFSVSVSVKLIPILFLPLFLKKLGWKKSILYYGIVGIVNVFFFIPFLSSELIENFMASIHLYFQNFEFNASIYYIIREIGYSVKGYNIIQTVGKITPIIVSVLILFFAFFKKNKDSKTLIVSMLFSILIYYSFASIVHPWYIAIPLFLSIFTKYRFPLVWSFFVILSYAAYINAAYHENLYLVTLEYTAVFGYLIYELFFKKEENAKKLYF